MPVRALRHIQRHFLSSCHVGQNQKMPVRALRLTCNTRAVQSRVHGQNQKMPVRALRRTLRHQSPRSLDPSESKNARKGIKTSMAYVLRRQPSESQNQKMPVRALRPKIRRGVWLILPSQNQKMPVRALRHTFSTPPTTCGFESESKNARKGIKTHTTASPNHHCA